MNKESWPASGDLVYVPSRVSLKKVETGLSGLNSVTDYLILVEPATMLVSQHDIATNICEVIYKGSKWRVDPKNLYRVQETL